MKRLDEIKIDSFAFIKKIDIKNEKVLKRLNELGIYENQIIKVYKKQGKKGPLIIKVIGYYLCISNNLAKSIKVDEINENCISWKSK